jgi:hypothetical protein
VYAGDGEEQLRFQIIDGTTLTEKIQPKEEEGHRRRLGGGGEAAAEEVEL